MPREITCPRCRQAVSVADEAPAPATCPHCQAPLDQPAPQPEPAGSVGLGGPSPGPPGRAPLIGRASTTTETLVYGLLPVLTVLCIGGIIFFAVKSRPKGGEKGIDDMLGRALGLACLFTFLDILVIGQLAYWMRWRRPTGGEVLKAAGKATAGAGVFILTALAALIFLFATCWVLANG